MQKGFTPIIILVGIVVLLAAAVGAGFLFYSNYSNNRTKIQQPQQTTQTPKPAASKGSQVCIQVITPAKNSKTGECKNFPTPCDVPAGWEKVQSCSASSVDTTPSGELLPRYTKNDEYLTPEEAKKVIPLK